MAGKADIINNVAERLNVTKATAEEALSAVLEAIKEESATERLTLRGFGSFFMKTRSARVVRNPQTGESLKIAEKTKLAFKPL